MSLLLRVPFPFSPIEGGLAATGRGRKEEGEHLAAVTLATLRWVGLRGERERGGGGKSGRWKSEEWTKNFQGRKPYEKQKKSVFSLKQKKPWYQWNRKILEKTIQSQQFALTVSLCIILWLLRFSPTTRVLNGERKWLAFRSRHYFLLYPYFPFFSRERASVLAEKKYCSM